MLLGNVFAGVSASDRGFVVSSAERSRRTPRVPSLRLAVPCGEEQNHALRRDFNRRRKIMPHLRTIVDRKLLHKRVCYLIVNVLLRRYAA